MLEGSEVRTTKNGKEISTEDGIGAMGSVENV